jgi:xylulokinase
VTSKDSCILGVDIGTGSVKALLVGPLHSTLGVSSAPIEIVRPRPLWAECDPETWWKALRTAVTEAIKAASLAPRSVEAIGLSAQMHTLVLATENAESVRPAIVWLDGRAEEDLDAFRSLPFSLKLKLGNPLVAGMTGPLLHWLCRKEPESLERAAWVLQPKDWVRLRLVGMAASEQTDASATLLYDLFGEDWAWEVVDALRLPRHLLPPLYASDDLAGLLGQQPAQELGLPTGIPVAFGAGDTAAALVGSGIGEPGQVFLNIGSAAQVVAIRERPSPDPDLRYHLFASVRPRQWYALAGVQAAGIALSWGLSVLQATWEEAYGLIGETDGSAGDLFFIPHLAGARSPSMDASARGAFLGADLRHDRLDLLKAIFEGVAFSIADAAWTLPEAHETEAIYLAGGGSLNPAWRRFLCDLLGKRLLVIDNPNASARGAALLAAKAAGLLDKAELEPRIVASVEPDPKRHDRLLNSYSHWKHFEQLVVSGGRQVSSSQIST